jgi:hypothetical protein
MNEKEHVMTIAHTKVSAWNRFGVAFRRATTVGGAGICVACGYSMTATDGRVLGTLTWGSDPTASVLMWSAAHDLPCALDKVVLVDRRGDPVLSGCGWQVVYRVGDLILLLSRSPLATGGEQPLPIPAVPSTSGQPPITTPTAR